MTHWKSLIEVRTFAPIGAKTPMTDDVKKKKTTAYHLPTLLFRQTGNRQTSILRHDAARGSEFNLLALPIHGTSSYRHSCAVATMPVSALSLPAHKVSPLPHGSLRPSRPSTAISR